MKKVCVLFGLLAIFMSAVTIARDVYVNSEQNNNYHNRKNNEYEYMYMNPPKPSLQVAGRYVIISSGVRYSHSPSKRKRAAHAARINAYNYELGNY